MNKTHKTQWYHHLELLKHLTMREIKARYKQSFLGYLWILLNPFFQMLIMSFVFSMILRPQALDVPFPIFLYSGLLPWILLSQSLESSTSALNSNASLLKKVYFPREILLLSTLLAKVFDFALSSLIFVGMMMVYQTSLSWHALLFIPIFFVQFIFTIALGLFLSASNLYYRDVQYVNGLILRLWFYLTPIIYAPTLFPEHLRWLFLLNPMSSIVQAYRSVLLYHELPSLLGLGLAVAISVVGMVVSFSIFKKLEGTFADVV